MHDTAPNSNLLLSRSEKSLINWPTERQIKQVSARLVRITKVGARAEAKGDYFHSGNLAYEVCEIIRATDELLWKTERLED